MSHLGKTTFQFDSGVLTPTGPNTFTITISVTVTAANGDQLIGDISGSGTTDASGNAQGTSVTTFTGGTRRFTGASGSVSGPFTRTLISTDGVTSTFRHRLLAERHD